MVQNVSFRYNEKTPYIYKNLEFGIDLDTRWVWFLVVHLDFLLKILFDNFLIINFFFKIYQRKIFHF
jgi:hypothetical protein